MLEWSDFFYGKLLEQQKMFAKSMNLKHWGKFFNVLKAFRSKKQLPIYQDVALHKVVKELYKIDIAKSTVSEWINRVPELLWNDQELLELLENKEDKKNKDETKYTKEEWEYLHKLEWEKIMSEQRVMLEKLNNPKLPDKELMKLTWASQRLINKINNYWITMSDKTNQEQFVELTEKIMLVWNKRLLREIENMPAFNMRDLKALSGIIDDSMKQNRLLTGQSTENVAHWVDDIYEAILKKAEEIPKIEDWKVETAKIIKE